MLECLEGTHFVDVFQRSLHVQSSDILECWEGTHYVDVCQRSLHVQSRDVLECWEGLMGGSRRQEEYCLNEISRDDRSSDPAKSKYKKA